MKLNPKNSLFLVLLLLGLSSCGDSIFSNKQEHLDPEQDFQLIDVHHEYSLLVPKYMHSDSTLHEEASLAYHNELREVATIVLDEYLRDVEDALPALDGYVDTASLIANYLEVQCNLIGASLEFPEKSSPEYFQVDKLPAAQTWMEGRIEDMDIAYLLTCIQGEEKIYLVLSYTSVAKKLKYSDTFKKIGNSFLLKNQGEK